MLTLFWWILSWRLFLLGFRFQLLELVFQILFQLVAVLSLLFAGLFGLNIQGSSFVGSGILLSLFTATRVVQLTEDPVAILQEPTSINRIHIRFDT